MDAMHRESNAQNDRVTPSKSPPKWTSWEFAGMLGVLVAGSWWCGSSDGLVLTALMAVVRGLQRRALAVATVLLYTGAFPPYSWPTVWCCFAPLAWMWREREPQRRWDSDVLEALAVGFAMGWLSTGFVREAFPTEGAVLHATACFALSLPVVGLAITIRLTRGWTLSAATVAWTVAAVLGEWLESQFAEVVWSVTSLSLAAAHMPVAQWAAVISPLGVSGLLYFVNFLWAATPSTSSGLRWVGPVGAVSLLTAVWLGGCGLAAAARVEPLPFSVMLVQPHLRGVKDQLWQPWRQLDPLTQQSLRRDGPVDLIVWPETSLSDSRQAEPDSATREVADRVTIHEFASTFQPAYRTNCLAGVSLWRPVTVQRHGLEIAEAQRFNCGCLFDGSNEIETHDKLALVPFKEMLPDWLPSGWLRDRVTQLLEMRAPLTPGRDFRTLKFRDRRGSEHAIAVSVCYESFLPRLPQYHVLNRPEAIVHLVYDGDTIEHRGLLQRQILACRLRAIETRTWNLVCSTWTGSAVIDPTGRVVQQLSAEAGVLRSDEVHPATVAGHSTNPLQSRSQR
jgi:apolipoprotein N-acyltransferase